MNIIKAVRDVTVRVPGLPVRIFLQNEEIQPSSRYYFTMLWSGNATDTGIPATDPPAPETANPMLASHATRKTGDTAIYNESTGLWEPKSLKTKVHEVSADTRKMFRMGANSYIGAGPVAADTPTVTTGAAGDAAYNQQYQNAAIPSVVQAYGVPSNSGSNYSAKSSVAGIATVSTYSFMTDSDKFSLFAYAGGFVADLFVDGRPFANNPITLGASSGFAPYGFNNFVFPAAKPAGRLIEFRTISGVSALFCVKPYRIWKPPLDPRPKITVTGDSFVAPTVMSDTAAGGASELYSNGAYQRMAMQLGTPNLVTDGIGGTGYLAGGGSNLPYSHATRIQWVIDRAPDIHIVHGGGANDFYNGFTLAATITAAKAYFTALRAALPYTKLVFVEGFAPPLAGFAGNNANYIALRTALQTELAAIGVYYIDVATTLPAISGTGHGYVTAVLSDGNSNIYIGSDAVHLTVKGNQYVRAFLATKIAKVIADDGSLVNTLI